MAMTRKRVGIAVAAVLAVVLIAATAFHFMMTPPDDLDLSRAKTTAAGAFLVEIAPEAEPLRQGELHSWLVTVKRADGAPVEDAAITVDGGMPQHGHGLPTSPQASGHLGEGRYRIEGMRFNMGGWWELKLSIAAGGASDAATFNIVM